jgi:hypothetical protein
MNQTMLDTICIFTTINIAVICFTVHKCIKARAAALTVCAEHHLASLREQSAQEKGY